MTSGDTTFSKIVDLSRLKEPQTFNLAAPPDALAAIAARLETPAVISLSGAVVVTPTAEGAQVDGAVKAALRRECVVTLEPLDERIDETFSIRFARESDALAEIELDLEEDWTEPLLGEALDVADILVQQVALAMEPYPRKPGAAAPAALNPSPEQVSPFAVLKSLKPEPDSGS